MEWVEWTHTKSIIEAMVYLESSLAGCRDLLNSFTEQQVFVSLSANYIFMCHIRTCLASHLKQMTLESGGARGGAMAGGGGL